MLYPIACKPYCKNDNHSLLCHPNNNNINVDSACVMIVAVDVQKIGLTIYRYKEVPLSWHSPRPCKINVLK